MNSAGAKNANKGAVNFISSLIPTMNMNKGKNAVNGVFTNAVNSANAAVNAALNVGNSGAGLSSYIPGVGTILLLAFFIAAISLLVVYRDEVSKAFTDAGEVLRNAFTKSTTAETTSSDTPVLPSSDMGAQTAEFAHSIEKVLPGGGNEVFNVSSNRYTYYDAEPLCKAFGAELATYDQVKEAWSKGADWCNYGWTKGQLATYPTSEETYLKLQQGPAEQALACGRPGVNGGYFDNPEMRFGVNCYGKKPSKTDHDDRALATSAPVSPEAIAFDKKVAEFKLQAPTVGILPFNSKSWN